MMATATQDMQVRTFEVQADLDAAADVLVPRRALKTDAEELGAHGVTASIPLPLRGVRSVRDLGGYPLVDGEGHAGFTTTGAFLRGGSLFFLTRSDVEMLRAYGVTRVIDLRSPFELRRFKDAFCRGRYPDIDYVSVPMMDQINSRGISGQVPDRMSDVYCSILDDDAASVRQVFMALDDDGCVLFHCRCGKDRTGVIAMLLLKLVGASDDAVIADYAVSDRYSGRTMGLQRVGLRIIARRPVTALFVSAPDEMERTLDHLYREYGSAREYLEQVAEVPADVLDRIVTHLAGRSVVA